ncbi:CLUMA_CG015497, isoform A [Clunio marinus]|uniref:CLUMA_CG015497, isoform A n=1 Tax=Clunio marinus TaxID=568069 RepID=A0A1J1ISR0_9DIPT|nr:CLUMA_CG015497, isoform A [Clunio marinus]
MVNRPGNMKAVQELKTKSLQISSFPFNSQICLLIMLSFRVNDEARLPKLFQQFRVSVKILRFKKNYVGKLTTCSIKTPHNLFQSLNKNVT